MGKLYYIKDGYCTHGHGGIVPEISFYEARSIASGIVAKIPKIDLYRVAFYYTEEHVPLHNVLHHYRFILSNRDNMVGLGFKNDGIVHIDTWELYKEHYPEEQRLEDYRKGAKDRAYRKIKSQNPKKMKELIKQLRRDK